MSTNNKLIIALFIGIVVVIALFILNQEDKGIIKKVPTKRTVNPSVTQFPTSSTGIDSGQTTQPETNGTIEDVKELKIEDIKIGTGDEAVSGKKVTVNYSGTLTNGTKFDSSYDRGTPFAFNLGTGQVIKGWDQGVAGMKVGGKRRLIIPPDLGYGSNGAGSTIPPNATLVFEVELLKVE